MLRTQPLLRNSAAFLIAPRDLTSSSAVMMAARLAVAAVAALIAAAPFEWTEPIGALPGQKITNLEALIAVALVVGVFGLRATGRRFDWRVGLLAPAVAWLAVLLIASLAAPAHHANALKTTGRCAAGLAVLLVATNALRSAASLTTVAVAAVTSGVIVAVAGVLEHAQVPAVLDWLTAFRPGTHIVGGAIRVSSTLQYPTITSMYLEIVFALGLGLLLVTIDARRWRWTLATFASLVLIARAIMFTLTRAGLITMAVSLVVALVVRWRRYGIDTGVRVLGALATTIAALVLYATFDSLFLIRLTTADALEWYQARFEAPSQLTLAPGERRDVIVSLTNHGRATWRSDADPPFYLSYHWLAAEGDAVVQFDGLRTAFAAPVAPGATVRVAAQIQAPRYPGRYRLLWDVVIEDRLWFSLRGSASGLTRAQIAGPQPAGVPPPTMKMPRAATRPRRPELWGAGMRMLASHPWLGIGPDNFRLEYGREMGLPFADDRVHTNNMYLEAFVGSGIVGGLLFLWMFWRVVTRLWSAWSELTAAALSVFAGVSAAVAAILVHGLVDSFLTFTPTYLMLWLTLALAMAIARLNQKDDPRRANRV